MIGSHTNRQAINHLKLFGVIIAACIFFVSSPTIAQERSGLGSDENLKGQDEAGPHMDSHTATTSAHSTTPAVSREKENYRDTVAIKPAAVVRTKPDALVLKKTEEETLSFNFLYFIIQKFKVSDMKN